MPCYPGSVHVYLQMPAHLTPLAMTGWYQGNAHAIPTQSQFPWCRLLIAHDVRSYASHFCLLRFQASSMCFPAFADSYQLEAKILQAFVPVYAPLHLQEASSQPD